MGLFVLDVKRRSSSSLGASMPASFIGFNINLRGRIRNYCDTILPTCEYGMLHCMIFYTSKKGPASTIDDHVDITYTSHSSMIG